MVSQLKRSSQNNVPRHLVQPSDMGVLGGDITVSNFTLTKVLKNYKCSEKLKLLEDS